MPSDEKIQKILREEREENLAVREAIGIPPDLRPLRTVYNAVASVVAASVEHHSSARFERRLFFRHTSERAYHSIGSPPPDVHYDDLVTSSTQATIYYTVRRITKSERSGEFGGDWQSVDRFDLKNQTSDTIISRGAMQLPSTTRTAGCHAYMEWRTTNRPYIALAHFKALRRARFIIGFAA